MATLHDTAFGDAATGGGATSTTVSNGDALTQTTGDLIVAGLRWEDSSGATISSITDGTTTLTDSGLGIISVGGILFQALYWGIALSSGSKTYTATLSAAKKFLRLRLHSFTPTSGATWPSNPLDVAAVGASATSTSISSGAASADAAAKLAVVAMATSSNRTLTYGSGWLAPSEFTANEPTTAFQAYKTLSGAGSVTGDATFTSTNEWTALMAVFKETSAAAVAQALNHLRQQGIA